MSVGSAVQKTIKEHDRRALITLPRAIDPDWGVNGSVVYLFPEALKNTPIYQKFSIEDNPTEGPHIRVVGDIDKEITPGPFRLVVTARDRGQPSKETNLTLVVELIDTNDFPPQFQPLKINPVKVID